jgi:CRISPR/Cas system CSM-associated protein Csm3 (group 7 of RAMP superfamily)
MDRRLSVRGRLQVKDALHVGGLAADADVDLALAVDGNGHLYVPGTGLAGALRAWADGVEHGPLEGRRLRDLWGWAERDPDAGQASRVIVHDGLVTASPDDDTPLPRSRVAVRTSVGIDRVTGAAAPGILFDRAVIPAGAAIMFRLEIEARAAGRDLDVARLWCLVEALRRGEICLGAAKTRGLGRVLLVDGFRVEESALDSPRGLIAFLNNTAASISPGRTEPTRSSAGMPEAPRSLEVTIKWRPVAPVMVRASVSGAGVDSLPLTATASDGTVRLLLPGSSIKGALRSHAERIARTVLRLTAPAAPPAREGNGVVAAAAAFREQLDGPGVVLALFGAAPRPLGLAGASPSAGGDWGLGAVAVDDVHTLEVITSKLWESVVNEPWSSEESNRGNAGGEPGQAPRDTQKRSSWAAGAVREVNTANGGKLRFGRADHVAIDRWRRGRVPSLQRAGALRGHLGTDPAPRRP